MYKVFFVDDEIVIREGIRNSGIWENGDFVLAGEASDGELALSMLQDVKPDILLTDVRMPFMDGLELCRNVRRIMPWVYIIILSGYDDFAYAREAITLGVQDYLLKPVNAKELSEAFLRIAQRIETEKQRQRDLLKLREHVDSSNVLLREKLLRELLSGAVSEEGTPAFLERSRELQLDLFASRYLALLIAPEYGENRYEQLAGVRLAVSRLTANSGGTLLYCEGEGEPVLLVLGDNHKDIEERGYGVAQSAQYEVERSAGVRVRVSLGEIVDKLHLVAKSFATAKQVLRAMDTFGDDERGHRSIMGTCDVGIQPPIRLTELNVLPIAQQLQFVALDELDDLLDRHIESLGVSSSQSTMMAHYLYVEITLAASKLIKESGGVPADALPPEATQESEALRFTTLDEIRPLLIASLQAAVRYRDEQSSTRYGIVIRKAQAYINEHFGDANISLGEVAGEVALSNNHFCTVFSQEMGVTFTEYLTDLRVKRAAELLRTTALRASEIAYQVGYNDPHYFGYLFRKHYGVSPRDFRRDGGGA